MSTLKQISKYERALREWKERGGLHNGGGDYDRKTGGYLHAPEPAMPFSPETFEGKVAAQARKKILGL
jgi:hypothetical protein